MGKRFHSLSLAEMALLTGVLVTVCAFLSPIVAASKAGSPLTDCQANMRRIGGAIKQYLADWDRYYPTNRNPSINGQPGALSQELQLAQPGIDPATGKPYRNVNGNVTWVEGLYGYIEPIKALGENGSVWKCPAANLTLQGGKLPYTRASAEVTYVINFNVLELHEKRLRSPGKIMLIREGERLHSSVCRGSFAVTGMPSQVLDSSGPAPRSVFLGTSDLVMIGQQDTNPLNCKLHGSGSNMLFADGHVAWFDASEFGTGDAVQGMGDNAGYWTSKGGNVYCTP